MFFFLILQDKKASPIAEKQDENSISNTKSNSKQNESVKFGEKNKRLLVSCKF